MAVQRRACFVHAGAGAGPIAGYTGAEEEPRAAVRDGSVTRTRPTSTGDPGFPVDPGGTSTSELDARVDPLELGEAAVLETVLRGNVVAVPAGAGLLEDGFYGRGTA